MDCTYFFLEKHVLVVHPKMYIDVSSCFFVLIYIDIDYVFLWILILVIDIDRFFEGRNVLLLCNF